MVMQLGSPDPEPRPSARVEASPEAFEEVDVVPEVEVEPKEPEIPSMEALLQMLEPEPLEEEPKPEGPEAVHYEEPSVATLEMNMAEDPEKTETFEAVSTSTEVSETRLAEEPMFAAEKTIQETPAPRRRRKGFSSVLESLPADEEKADVPSMEALLSMLDGKGGPELLPDSEE